MNPSDKPPRRRRAAAKRAAVVRGLWRAAAAKVDEIERRLQGDTQSPDEGERDARTLAVLARTLRDLDALEEARPGGGLEAEQHDDPVPTDIDEFRHELARRLNALVDQRTAAGGDGDSG